MITAHRNTRHFNLPVSRRSFDVDAYLNQQLALQAEERRLNALEANSLNEVMICPTMGVDGNFVSVPHPRLSDLRSESQSLSSYRAWALRLNNRIETWLDRTDFKAIELKVERIFLPIAFTGIIFYLMVKVADAIVSGAVAAAVR